MKTEPIPGLRPSTFTTMLVIVALALGLTSISLIAAGVQFEANTPKNAILSPVGHAFFASMIPLSITFQAILLATVGGFAAIVLSRSVHAGDVVEALEVRRRLGLFVTFLGVISLSWWFICCFEAALDSTVTGQTAAATVLALINLVVCAYVGSFAPGSLQLQSAINHIELTRTQQRLRSIARDDQLGTARSVTTVGLTVVIAWLTPVAAFGIDVVALGVNVPANTPMFFVILTAFMTLLSGYTILGATILKTTPSRTVRVGGWALYCAGVLILAGEGAFMSVPGSAGNVWLWSLGGSLLISASLTAVSSRPGIRDHLRLAGRFSVDAALDGIVERNLRRAENRLAKRRIQLAAARRRQLVRGRTIRPLRRRPFHPRTRAFRQQHRHELIDR